MNYIQINNPISILLINIIYFNVVSYSATLPYPTTLYPAIPYHQFRLLIRRLICADFFGRLGAAAGSNTA